MLVHVVALWGVRLKALKRAFGLPGCLIVLALALALGGCSLRPTSQQTLLAASGAKTSSTQPIPVVATQPPLVGAVPVGLRIPAIGLKTGVESLGILSNGDLATPTQSPWEDVGWYNLGPRPGQRGSAVIDGHLDRPGGRPAVFWHLRDLHIDDAVLVTTAAGKTLQFHVTRIALYASQAAPLQDIFGNTGGTYLNLITCAGDWIPSQHQTTLRLVVYTSLG